MTDEELRAMIRDSIARHAARPGQSVVSGPGQDRAALASHASHLQLPLVRGGDGDGACIIEPAVRCNHCGFCLSYGH
jgi:hypothetical protein